MSDMECKVRVHMGKEITLKQYAEFAKAMKEAYENRTIMTLRNELMDILFS